MMLFYKLVADICSNLALIVPLYLLTSDFILIFVLQVSPESSRWLCQCVITVLQSIAVFFTSNSLVVTGFKTQLLWLITVGHVTKFIYSSYVSNDLVKLVSNYASNRFSTVLLISIELRFFIFFITWAFSSCSWTVPRVNTRISHDKFVSTEIPDTVNNVWRNWLKYMFLVNWSSTPYQVM